MIIILGQFTHASPGAAQEALHASVDGTIKAAQRPGCTVYGHALDAVDPTKIWGIHVFDDVRAMRAHMAADYFPPIMEAVLNPAVAVDLRRYVGEAVTQPLAP